MAKLNKPEPTMRLPPAEYNPKSTYICGLDIARTGKDETAIVILEQLPFDENIFVVYIETLHTPKLTTAINRIVYLDGFFNFKKIIIDETGMGAGVVDILKDKFFSRVEGVWYTQKLKVEMFNNLKLLMIRKEGRLHIPDYMDTTNPNVKKMFYQFLSIVQEYKDDDATKLPKISHESREHDDIINAIALAALYFKVGKAFRRKYPFGGFA